MSSSQTDAGANLQALNSQTLGAQFPEITLPDGSKVRRFLPHQLPHPFIKRSVENGKVLLTVCRKETGTVGALLKNIERYNGLHGTLSDADADANTTTVKDELAGLEAAFRSSLPMLFKVGFFNLFTPDEWVAGTSNPGRKKVGEFAMEWIREKGTVTN